MVQDEKPRLVEKLQFPKNQLIPEIKYRRPSNEIYGEMPVRVQVDLRKSKIDVLHVPD